MWKQSRIGVHSKYQKQFTSSACGDTGVTSAAKAGNGRKTENGERKTENGERKTENGICIGEKREGIKRHERPQLKLIKMLTLNKIADPQLGTIELERDVVVGPSPLANAAVDINKYDRLRLSVDQYTFFKEHGWIKVPGVFTKDDLAELNEHLDNVLSGKDKIPGFNVDPSLSTEDKQHTFSRIHMLHRRHALHEKYLLHPRVLDVVEQLCSPDILALQTITFFKEPGQPGQGYHQDSYYIHTLPNTLIAAWIALTPATTENGCLWLSDKSHVEPIYPNEKSVTSQRNAKLDGIFYVKHSSRPDTNVNELVNVGQKYTEIPGDAEPGDAFFFSGTLLHRSHANCSKSDCRRAFTSHYCDARSYVPWNAGEKYDGPCANDRHILARGESHHASGGPKFGMPVNSNK